MNNPDRNPARAMAFRTALAVGALTATDAVVAGQVDAQNAATNPNCKITLNGRVEPAGSRVNVRVFDGRNNELLREVTLPASIEITRRSNASTKRPSPDHRTASELASFTARVQVVDSNSKDQDASKGNEINTVCGESNGFTITAKKDAQATAAVATKEAQASATPTKTPEPTPTATATTEPTATATPDRRSIPEALATAQAESIDKALAEAKSLAQKGDSKGAAQIIESVRKNSASELNDRLKLEQTLSEIEQIKSGTPLPTKTSNPTGVTNPGAGANTALPEVSEIPVIGGIVGILDTPARLIAPQSEGLARIAIDVVGNALIVTVVGNALGFIRRRLPFGLALGGIPRRRFGVIYW